MQKASTALAFATLILAPILVSGCADAPAGASCEGEWIMSNMEMGGETVGEEDLRTLQSMGLEIRLALNAHGEATLHFLGDEEEGTWQARPSGCVLFLSGDEIAATLEEETLSLSNRDQIVSFVRTP